MANAGKKKKKKKKKKRILGNFRFYSIVKQVRSYNLRWIYNQLIVLTSNRCKQNL